MFNSNSSFPTIVVFILGNMELKLDRSLQERRIFPAIDILKSGTRREDDLLSKDELEAMWKLRRELGRQNPVDAMNVLLHYIQKTDNNKELIKLINEKIK